MSGDPPLFTGYDVPVTTYLPGASAIKLLLPHLLSYAQPLLGVKMF